MVIREETGMGGLAHSARLTALQHQVDKLSVLALTLGIEARMKPLSEIREFDSYKELVDYGDELIGRLQDE